MLVPCLLLFASMHQQLYMHHRPTQGRSKTIPSLMNHRAAMVHAVRPPYFHKRQLACRVKHRKQVNAANYNIYAACYFYLCAKERRRAERSKTYVPGSPAGEICTRRLLTLDSSILRGGKHMVKTAKPMQRTARESED